MRSAGAYKSCLGVGLRMIVIVGYREARQLDVARQTGRVDGSIVGEAFAHEDLGAVNMVRRQSGIRRAARQLYHVAVGACHEPIYGIGAADAPQIANIVRKSRQNDV